MTQPPLSQQIAVLEESLGVPLFIRDRRSVQLTEAGAVLLTDARRLLDTIKDARQRAIDVGTGKTGRLRIGFVGPAIDGPLSSDIKHFRKAHPYITFELHEKTTDLQLAMLRSNELDAGFVRLMGHSPTGLDSTLYHSEQYVLAVPEESPLAHRQSVPIAALDNMPFILFPRRLNPLLFDAWVTAFSNSDARLNIAQEAVTKHTSVALVAAGHGVSPVPQSTAETGYKGVAFIALLGNIPKVELHLVTGKRPPSSSLAAFIKHLDV